MGSTHEKKGGWWYHFKGDGIKLYMASTGSRWHNQDIGGSLGSRLREQKRLMTVSSHRWQHNAMGGSTGLQVGNFQLELAAPGCKRHELAAVGIT